MKIIDWERIIDEESEETVQLYIEEIKLRIKGHKQAIRQQENEIIRAEKYISEANE